MLFSCLCSPLPLTKAPKESQFFVSVLIVRESFDNFIVQVYKDMCHVDSLLNSGVARIFPMGEAPGEGGGGVIFFLFRHHIVLFDLSPNIVLL